MLLSSSWPPRGVSGVVPFKGKKNPLLSDARFKEKKKLLLSHPEMQIMRVLKERKKSCYRIRKCR